MITEDLLIENGYKKETFFYQIGGGEDENDMPIFVKDGVAIAFEWTTKRWRKVKYLELNYINGWPEQSQEWIDAIERTPPEDQQPLQSESKP